MPEDDPRTMTSTWRRSGRTHRMLEEVFECDSSRIVIVAHSYDHAKDLRDGLWSILLRNGVDGVLATRSGLELRTGGRTFSFIGSHSYVDAELKMRGIEAEIFYDHRFHEIAGFNK